MMKIKYKKQMMMSLVLIGSSLFADNFYANMADLNKYRLKIKEVVTTKQPINCDGSKISLPASKYKRYLDDKYYTELYYLQSPNAANAVKGGYVAKEELNYFFEDYTFKNGKKIIFCVNNRDIKRLKNEK